MEPRIQYAKTSDGVSIAYATYGEGRPIVWSHQPIASHVQLEWEQPVLRAAYDVFAASGMLVRFDTRGVGLSDRNVQDVSLDARVRDLEAVVDQLQLEQFALVALETGGLPAIAYAAHFPERVSHLLLTNCYAHGEIRLATERGRALWRLTGDWEMFTENVGFTAFGFGWEGARRYAEFLRECIGPEMLLRMTEADMDVDVSGLLTKIQAPTLVIRHKEIKWVPMDATRELAAAIPNARLHLMEGFYQDNFGQLIKTTTEFLGFHEAATKKNSE